MSNGTRYFCFVVLLILALTPGIAMADCSWGGTATTTDTLGAPCNINWGDGTFQSYFDFQLYKTGSGPRIVGVQTSGTFSNSYAGVELDADHQAFSLRAYGSGFTQFSHPLLSFSLADWAEFWSDGFVPGAGKGLLIGTGGPYTTPAPIVLATNGAERLRILGGGNVQIGYNGNYVTTYGLDVNGTIHASNVIGCSYQDVAEWVPATPNMSAGTVVVLNPDEKNEVMPSGTPYDATVAGVVSAKPGIILGEPSPEKAQVATTGRVKVKVDATKAPIKIGDLLVTSDKPGTAMKSIPVNVSGISMHRPGTIIGKALEPLPSGEGEILVLLSLQ